MSLCIADDYVERTPARLCHFHMRKPIAQLVDYVRADVTASGTARLRF